MRILGIIGIAWGSLVFYETAYAKFSNSLFIVTFTALLFAVLPYLYVVLTSFIIFREKRRAILRLFYGVNAFIGLYAGILFLNIISPLVLIEMIVSFLIFILSCIYLLLPKKSLL
jgi:hypothetical protein